MIEITYSIFRVFLEYLDNLLANCHLLNGRKFRSFTIILGTNSSFFISNCSFDLTRPKTNTITTMSFYVESKKKAEFLDVTLKVEFVFESNKNSRVMPIRIVLGDHEIEGDLIICRVSHLNYKICVFTVNCLLTILGR